MHMQAHVHENSLDKVMAHLDGLRTASQNQVAITQEIVSVLAEVPKAQAFAQISLSFETSQAADVEAISSLALSIYRLEHRTAHWEQHCLPLLTRTMQVRETQDYAQLL